MPHRHKPLASKAIYYRRIGRSVLISGVVIGGSLALGTVGYHGFGHLDWLDAEYNAAMILTGMGPVNPMHTAAAKIFASAYALFSGVAFLSSVGLLVSPFFRRFLHRFHLEIEAEDPQH